jgi:ribosomal protein S16
MTKDEILAEMQTLTGSSANILDRAKEESVEDLMKDLQTLRKLTSRSKELAEEKGLSPNLSRLTQLREERTKILVRMTKIASDVNLAASHEEAKKQTEAFLNDFTEPAEPDLFKRIYDLFVSFRRKQHDLIRSNFSSKEISNKQLRVFITNYVSKPAVAKNTASVVLHQVQQDDNVVIDVVNSKPRSHLPNLVVLRRNGAITKKLGVYRKSRLQTTPKLRLDVKQMSELMNNGAVLSLEAAKLLNNVIESEATIQKSQSSSGDL